MVSRLRPASAASRRGAASRGAAAPRSRAARRTAAAPEPRLDVPGVRSAAVVLPHLVRLTLSDGATVDVPVADRGGEQPDGTLRLHGEAPGWTATMTAGPLLPEPARRELVLEVTATAAADAAVGLRVALADDHEPDWLVPGCFYGANRPAGCTRSFPRFSHRPDPADPLDHAGWAFRGDRAATPAVMAWDATGGAALAVDAETELGASGLAFAAEQGRAVLGVHAPWQETPVRYTGDASPSGPVVRTVPWAAGQARRLAVVLHLLGPDRRTFTDVVRHRHATTPAAAADATAWIGVSEAAALAAEGLRRWHHHRTPDGLDVLLETAAFDRELTGGTLDRRAMHVGWLSGAPTAAALLAHARRTGDAQPAAVGAAVLDTIAAHRTPGGTLWGQWSAERGWSAGWTGDPRRLHARTLGEAVTFLLRAARAERALGHPRPCWEAAARATLERAVAGQRASGELPAALDTDTGAPLDFRSTAGLAFVPALVEAGGPADLAAARAAGAFYAAPTLAGRLHGAPEDVDTAPSSEDGYVALMAYAALLARDGERWLEPARAAAEWMLGFRYTYDVAFAPDTLLGAYDFRTRGADQASPSNQHLHSYGLVADVELRTLAAVTGDAYLRASADEHLGCWRQFVARRDGDFGARRGMISERYHQTDCFAPKGTVLGLSHAWCAGLLLAACEGRLAADPVACAVLPAP
jgi:hypothetical protein